MKRETVAWILMFMTLVALVVATFGFTVYRFSHPELTETQLWLWSINQWWMWVAAVLAVAFWMTNLPRRR